MTVNQLMAKLRTMQREGYGSVAVHMIAHDNTLGESQGEVTAVSHFEKNEDDHVSERDLYDSTPNEMVYIS